MDVHHVLLVGFRDPWDLLRDQTFSSILVGKMSKLSQFYKSEKGQFFNYHRLKVLLWPLLCP
jgi:hypothetical protein